jgi:hypothetical protein
MKTMLRVVLALPLALAMSFAGGSFAQAAGVKEAPTPGNIRQDVSGTASPADQVQSPKK